MLSWMLRNGGGWCDGPLCKCAWYYVQTLFRMFVLMLHFLTWSQIYGKRSLNLVLSFRCLGLSESAPERRRNTIPLYRSGIISRLIHRALCISKAKPYPSASFSIFIGWRCLITLSCSHAVFCAFSTSSRHRECICGYNNNIMNLRSHVIKVLTHRARKKEQRDSLQ